MNATTETLRALRVACLKSAGEKSAACPGLYRQRKRDGSLSSPLEGHCGAVSSMLYGMFGGEIIGAIVEARILNWEDEPGLSYAGCQHFWNRLPDGRVVDLTSCQFGGDGLHALCYGKPDEPPALTPLPFLWFARRVLKRLR